MRIEQELQRLDRIREAGRQDFLQNADARDSACYRLLLAIEAALARCYHVSARRLRKVPDDYAGCFVTTRPPSNFAAVDKLKSAHPSSRFTSS